MTLPLTYVLSDDIAWIAVVTLFAYYIYRMAKQSGQYNYKCPICGLNVKKLNNGRWFRLTAHDKFTWRNPLAFFQTWHFDTLDHLKIWVDERCTPVSNPMNETKENS
jgi:hypothetical protein